jgi:hypothetical protein
VLEETLAAYVGHGGRAPAVRRLRDLHAATALSYLAWRARDPSAHDARSGRTAEQALAWARDAVAAALAER